MGLPLPELGSGTAVTAIEAAIERFAGWVRKGPHWGAPRLQMTCDEILAERTIGKPFPKFLFVEADEPVLHRQADR